MIYLRSTIFFLWFALVSMVLAVLFLPALAMPRKITVWMSRRWSELIFWGLEVFAGIGFEVRGQVPKNGVLVASKHMSMWDTMALYLVLDDPATVLRRTLAYVPFYGWYVTKAGSIPIDRTGGAHSLRRMAAAAKRAMAQGRSVLIFPEGSRVRVGAPPLYKPGVAGLYGQLGVECVPVALNSRLFWQGFIKHPGRIVLEFLEPIPPGLKSREFMRELQNRIETATAALIAEGRALRNER